MQATRLRRVLGAEAAARIIARDPVYVIAVDADELDIMQFEALCRDAGAAVQARRWRETVSAVTRHGGHGAGRRCWMWIRGYRARSTPSA